MESLLSTVMLSIVPDFRFAPQGSLARASEVAGERRTRLVIRELLLGSKRFSGPGRSLPRVSPGILSQPIAPADVAPRVGSPAASLALVIRELAPDDFPDPFDRGPGSLDFQSSGE